MEGVGARFGRSSTRYGPATVFTGPVRRWKKKWVHVSPSNNSSNNHHSQNQNHQTSINGTPNDNNGPHLLFYKWTPSSQNQNNSNGDAGGKNSPQEDALVEPEESPRRKFKYVPIALLEEHRTEDTEDDSENVEDESKPGGIDASLAEPAYNSDGFDGKADINDAPMEESQEDNKMVRQDLNESTMDLSLGLTAHEGDPDLNMDQSRKEELTEP